MKRLPASADWLADWRSDIWSNEPLLATALVRVYQKLSMSDQLTMLQHALALAPVTVPTLEDDTIEARVMWVRSTLDQFLEAYGVKFSPSVNMALKRTFVELEMVTPTHWELTVDITHTPAWREILEQFRVWSKLKPKQRVLVFTPEGSVALPADLPVGWAADEIQSQTHIMIACHWPKPAESISINARHMYAEQSCGKVEREFWN
jgi:hypothetical protein